MTREWGIVIVVCAIVGTVYGEYVRDTALCGRMECKVPASPKFKYKEDIIYRYKYSIDVSTNFGGTSYHLRNESTLYIDTVVSLQFTSPCEGTLRIANTSISHDRSRYHPEFPDRAGADFKSGLEKFPLKFAFHDGQIQELCPDRRDSAWSLNLKRGVLSLFQNTMKRFDVNRQVEELDINGICETQYRLFEARRTSLIVKKTKNLDSCIFGAKHLSVIQSTPYRSPQSRSTKKPLLKSSSECDIVIDHNIYERVVCRDMHKLEPLSSGNTGARTESTAILQLIEESKDRYWSEDDEDEEEEEEEEKEEENVNKYERSPNRIKRTNLLYDHSKTTKTMHGELRSARDLLKNMCKLGENTDELQHRFSEMFTAFVHSARFLDYPSLSQLFARVNSICKTGKKHIINALPYLGSKAGVNVMKDLIIKKYVNQETINNWVTTFALIPRPDHEIIRSLSPLLEFQHQIPEAQFILSYSAVIHAYCTNNEASCLRFNHVPRFLSYLEQRIEKGCTPSPHPLSEIKETLEALKAIGNMGLETKTLLGKLRTCIDDDTGFLPMEIRVAAIDAHRRLPSCEQTRDEFFLNYYRNFTLDPEIRIASYLQVMRCPDYNVVKTIKHTLKMEEVNQVGSFVWSHLTNLYKSASPSRVEIQSLLTDRDIGTKFNSDMRKFSRNYDGSFFSEEYNLGAGYQGNLIFSPKSYIPRSASFNLTIDLFGETVNLIEVTTRMEGLEYYAESLFGPDGPYSNEKVSNYFSSLLRVFRSAQQEEDYWKRVKRLTNVIDNNFDHPRVSFSYKVFGNDLKFTMLDGDKEIKTALMKLNLWEKLKQILSAQEIHYENTMMFLDSTYVVPTTSGLPVRLDLAGSAACNFKMLGLLDMKRWSSREIEFMGNIMPSINVDVVGAMTVDAFYKSSGVKLRSNVYSSGALEMNLSIKGLRLVRLSLGLPNHKMEVFSVSTNVSLVSSNGAEIEEKPLGVLIAGQNHKDSKQPMKIPSNVISNTTCSWTALDRLIGLKLCTDYQFSNVTKDPHAPYLIFSGPTLFKMSLIKADPTAKNYLLEYKWEETPEKNTFRLAFDTPGSQINREISATVTFDVGTQNVTVLLHSVGNSIIAKGTYKNTKNEMSLDVGFDINGTKHLDASIGYISNKVDYGYVYNPKLHLTVNNERIVALTGTIRDIHKNNVSQCDIDLTFQTKKVWSKLVGYIVKRNISLAGDFQLEYQLQKMPKKEMIHLEVSLINRSSKTLTHKAADLKLHSTAYPQLNTVITTWYQQALGHLELHAEVNSSPHLKDDRHKLTAQLIISYSKLYFQNQGTKVSALFAITKPIQNLDIKVGINHYAVGPESKTSLLIGYAPGKEISLVVNVVTPRGLMFAIEIHANLTIPNFNPMLVDLRINERSRREYDIGFAGTWFSGHNITARGTYCDRSTAAVVSYSLKMILKSPSFPSDILVNCKIHHKHSDLRINLYVEHVDLEKYAFILNHTAISPTRLLSYVEGRYKNNVYSVMTDIDTKREIRVEVHVDKWRDVHLTLTGINEEDKKEFGAEIKWDANRDPSLKFATGVRLERIVIPAVTSTTIQRQLPEKKLSALVTLTYPGRLVTGSCQLAVRGDYNYMMDFIIDWGIDKMIRMLVEVDYDLQETATSMKLVSQLLTPFEQWRRTSLNAKYLQLENKITASCSAYWKDSQHVIADFYGSTDNRDGVMEWIGNCGLSSTVHSISWITANLTHKMLHSRTSDSHVLIKYHPDKVIDAWSVWHLDKESDIVFNLTGNLHLESPMTNYKKSDMKCQFSLLPDWKLQGAANLDMDKRKYTASLVGDLLHLKESMVQFNLTTPIEKYAFLNGRFGLSERNRHVVAEVVGPSGSLGFEVILQLFTSSYDFNVKLLLATPIDILQKSLLVAKLNNQEADFRIAYNNITAGFQGVWHYSNIKDFHYSYILFTPLSGFEECGIITKLIIVHLEPDERLNLDVEFTVKIAELRAGIKAKGGPKPPPVRISIKPEFMATTKASIDDEDYEDEEETDEEDNFYWKGEAELYLVILDPIQAELDIDCETNTCKVLGAVQLVQGRIVVDDVFWSKNLLHIKNELSIETPFNIVNEITSHNVFLFDPERSVHMELDVNIRQNATWIESGFCGNYTYHESETDDSKTHTMQLNVKTPLDYLRFINTKMIMDIDENLYKTSLDVRGENCSIDVKLSSELEELFMDAHLIVEVDSPILKIPKTEIAGKKDFSDKEKNFKLNISVAEPVSKHALLESSWLIEDQNYIKISTHIDTWLKPLNDISANLFYSNTVEVNDTAKLNVYVHRSSNEKYILIGDYNEGAIVATLLTPASPKEHFKFEGVLTKTATNNSLYNVKGDLADLVANKNYKVSSDIYLHNNVSFTAETMIKPETPDHLGGGEISVVLKKERYGLKLTMEGNTFNSTIEMTFISSLSWDVRARAEIEGKEISKRDQYQFLTFFNVQVNGHTSLRIIAVTPWSDLKTLTFIGSIYPTKKSGHVKLDYHVNEDRRYLTMLWRIISSPELDLFGRLTGGYEIQNFGKKDLGTEVFYKFSKSKNVVVGFDVDIDREKWKFGANGSLSFPTNDGTNVVTVLSVRLPPPNNDVHRFLVSYHDVKGLSNMTFVMSYNALKAKTNYASDVAVKMQNKNIDGHFRVTWGMLPGQFIHNILKLTFDQREIDLKYSLYTPKFLDEETVILVFNHNGTSDVRNLINANVFYPARERVGTARIAYTSIVNINGSINVSTPMQNFPYIGGDFIVLTTLKQNKRFAELFWLNNTALLNSEYSYHSEKLDSNLEGIFQLEIPLNTRHVSHLTYGYKKRPQVTSGHGVFTYNKQEILHARYNSKSESRAGFEKDYIEITIENIYIPIGIVYINQYEYSGGNEGTNYPTLEFKQVNVYQLNNASAFNIAGESKIRTTHTGQNIYLKAVHSNRTVQLKTDYQILPGEFDQTTWLSLAKDAWVSYHVNILNKTTEEIDNQFIILSLAYPRKNFTLDGSYRITRDELNSDAKLEWDKDTDKPRNLGAAFCWKNFTATSMVLQQLAMLSLRHPSFEKDVTLKGEIVRRRARELANVAFTVDYSKDPEKLLVLSAVLTDESHQSLEKKSSDGFFKYSYDMEVNHPKTETLLDMEGFVYRRERRVETRNRAMYQRSFLPAEKGQFNCYVDTELKKFVFQREYNDEAKYLEVRYYPIYPQYVVNGSIINTPNLNATGEFFFDPREKLTWMMVNYTPDAVESLRMYGKIPDARNAMFDIWRTYDQDLVISDVAFYLKLNHSRLVTSTLRWRPELKSDILNFTKTTFMNFYDGLNNDADYWKQYIKSETISVISDVWENAQEDLREFIDDWNNLKEIETDLEDLKRYLNDSYNANDFYVKDIVACAIYVIDELSLRSHIQSLPNIFNEIWEIMGESGEAIRNSLLWVIDTIKSAYHKVSEIISAVLRGDSVSQVANIIEKLIEKYDIFVKDLHVSFIKYIENLWNKIAISIHQQWHRLLRFIEPAFIRLVHYCETVVWKASKEVVDFMYDRQNEIMTSPYFDRFSKLSQDIDKFYRDIKANDIITNIQKYSGILIQFLQERYFTFVPFGKELKDVIDEIILELKELKKLPSVHYALEKMQQVYDRANYFYEYFEIRARIESFVRLIHAKLVDISQTALEAENRYREAKTLFIFDPNQGLMCLEQKLPMSWHAFNQTPEFHEIPEIRAISDMKSYFVASNTTFWSLYYKYKPYTEPSNWSPPFRAQAMIAGAQHYKTFDGRYFDFTGSCTYLLARDFVRDTFAILVKYRNAAEVTHKIIVLIGENAIELDVFYDRVRLISNSSNVATNLQLPIALENGTIYVYQKENVVTVERKNDQFRLECNLKFNLCTLELSGWYYGKTAGLLGTMNNEQIDDTIGSNGQIIEDVKSFADSWAIDEKNCHESTDLTQDVENNLKENVLDLEDTVAFEFCEELFVNKSSEFSSCFGVIDPGEYARMCLESRSDAETCTIAMAYMQVCMFHDTYLRIPDKCTTCTMIDGSQVAEGEIRRLEGSNVPRSVDVVFIVEAKECNRGIKQNRSIEQLITQMSKEFKDQNLVGNRWSLVVFGGDGVYDQPRSIILDGQIFTKNAARFVDYFGDLSVGSGSQDIFAAIRFVSQLVFRAGVAKTFILMPCSHCEPENQRLDYSVLHQVLLEHDITLHILMDGDFQFEKERLNKIFYGIDATRSYTKKDARTLTGDVGLRRQVKLSKSVLGYCTPLSLETNGTIFSGDKLRFDKLASIKKFASVFSKRVALSALPSLCQNCECTANNEGVTQMECMPCVYPIPATVDYVSETFNLNDSLAALQPLDADYGQIDVEDD